MKKSHYPKSYASFGISRSLNQIRYALGERQKAEENAGKLLELVRLHESWMRACSQRPIEEMRILEIGPGQGLERALYFSLHNEVIAIDLDVIPVENNLSAYWHMLRKNGLGRVAKTIGRRVILDGPNKAAWAKAVGSGPMTYPRMVQGNICEAPPDLGKFDMVMSWSVFEHLPDPKKALENVIRLLKAGGVFFISIHLFTANNGHHDIRAFTGQEDQLPLWGHLRPEVQDQINPSSYLNQWRIAQWRELFNQTAPGCDEYREEYKKREKYSPRLSDELRGELRDYSDEELFTVDLVYVWQKPDPSSHSLVSGEKFEKV